MSDLSLNDSDIECLCGGWLSLMNNLTSLTLDLSNNFIYSEGAGIIASTLENLTLLNYLSLNFENN